MPTLQSLIASAGALGSVNDIGEIKSLVKQSYDWIESEFDNAPVQDLVMGRASFVDALLQRLWTLVGLAKDSNLALCAVGGYGRGHLQPHSDIDLLIVSQKTLSKSTQELVSQFITLLWDIKLDVGQSVRTVKETTKLAKGDITIATNLVESRLLIGSEKVFSALWNAVNVKDTWSSKSFFMAKYDEQLARHAKFHGTSYNLEPNIKENPGC